MASRVTPSTTPMSLFERPPPPTEELQQPEDYKRKFTSKAVASKMSDPCEAASKASMDCLDRTSYNRAECYEFFKAYRECKSRWVEQRRADRQASREGRPVSS